MKSFNLEAELFNYLITLPNTMTSTIEYNKAMQFEVSRVNTK